jgi:hypothetical protein
MSSPKRPRGKHGGARPGSGRRPKERIRFTTQIIVGFRELIRAKAKDNSESVPDTVHRLLEFAEEGGFFEPHHRIILTRDMVR